VNFKFWRIICNFIYQNSLWFNSLKVDFHLSVWLQENGQVEIHLKLHLKVIHCNIILYDAPFTLYYVSLLKNCCYKVIDKYVQGY